MAKFKLIKEFFEFIFQSKKLWLIPIIIVFIFLALVILFSHSSAIAPLIYTLF